jgi:putative membrane protein
METAGDIRSLFNIFIFAFVSVLAWSVVQPYSYSVWLLDAIPAMAAFVAVIATHRLFPLTPLAYSLILALCLLILVGAHYSFGKVPFFDWLKPLFGSQRNNFDKLAHFFQGFSPAVVFREIFIRSGVFRDRRWLAAIVAALCLALSAAYELVEWAVAVALRDGAEDFLAMQGDLWDAQSDMAFALAGALISLALLSRRHDKQIERLS